MANVVYREDPRDGKVKGFMSPKQNCTLCGKRVEPIFKAARSAEDWFWLECEECDEIVCDQCSETNEQGHTTCNDCYESGVWRRA